MAKANQHTTSIWSIWIRLIHGFFIILFALLYWTADQGMMTYHQYCGITLLLLIIIRIFLGLWGDQYMRFSSFIYSPSTVLTYSYSLFQRNSVAYAGHNPMGGYMVIIMLALLATQATLGLFGTDEITFDGPLSYLISTELSVSLTGWHHWLFDIILYVVGLHVLAVLWYQCYKKQRLIQAMIHGKKFVSAYSDNNDNMTNKHKE